MTSFSEIAKGLIEPFRKDQIKSRKQGGVTLSYATARSYQNRLDEVVGWENWWAEFTHHERSVECKLSVRLPDGRVVTKSDFGACAGMSDEGDDDKSGASDAFKRAAAQFGVGRHLYGDGTYEIPNATFVAGDANATADEVQQALDAIDKAASKLGRPRSVLIRLILKLAEHEKLCDSFGFDDDQKHRVLAILRSRNPEVYKQLFKLACDTIRELTPPTATTP